MEKLLVMLTLLMAISFPAMANQEMNYEYQADDSAFMLGQQLDQDNEKLYSRCYARPRAIYFRRYTYIGSGLNRWFASRSALRNCYNGLRRFNFWAARQGCYISHCYNFLKEDSAQ